MACALVDSPKKLLHLVDDARQILNKEAKNIYDIEQADKKGKSSAEKVRTPNGGKDSLFIAAIEAGCCPVWVDGIFGPAWHCGCTDLRHACDQQCSMITEKSLVGEKR